MSRFARAIHWLQRLQEQVDAEERRLLIQACVVGVVVWAFVALLKLAVREGFALMASLLALAPNVAFVWIPLLLGALAVSWVSQRRPITVYYRDAQKKLHPLDAVEGDGLERAIALYFSSEPMLERLLRVCSKPRGFTRHLPAVVRGSLGPLPGALCAVREHGRRLLLQIWLVSSPARRADVS